MPNKCYSVNDWDELETVYLGSFVDPKFVDEIFDHKHLQPFLPYLRKIANETYDDLNMFQRQMEDMGIQVVRPEQDKITKQQANSAEKFKLTLDESDVSMPADIITQIPIALAARNDFMVFGDEILANETMTDFYSLDRFDAKIVEYNDEYMHLPSITRLGSKLLVGKEVTPKQYDWLRSHYENIEFQYTNIEGHVDASLACIREGLLITARHYEDKVYTDTFPGWETISVGDQGWKHMCKTIASGVPSQDIVRAVNQHANDSWWIDGLEKDDNIAEIANIINKYFDNWIGYSEETYFEVNCLTVNPDLSFVLGDKESDMANKLKAKGHEIIPVKWRNRWFFDQGLHCITTDIKRKK